MSHREFRRNVLVAMGASGGIVDELLDYNENRFHHQTGARPPSFPLPDEPYVEAWRGYARAAEQRCAADVLRNALRQLQFPIQPGISDTQAYRGATRRGEFAGAELGATGLQLTSPESIRLVLHQSLAGTVPVIVAGERADFVSLVQALAHRNEPTTIPHSMGAVMIGGYNNWDRIAALKAAWEKKNPGHTTGTGWNHEFRTRIVPNKELYQDRFIILSSGPYSGVSAAEIALSELDWRQASQTIRLEHECTHYLTRRLLGAMSNNLLDELIADYRGIVAATGLFRADWFLRFMGLEEFPNYRRGGRLENYRGEPPLSDEAFAVLQRIVLHASQNVEAFHRHNEASLSTWDGQARMVLALTRLTLEELASDESAVRLHAAIRS